MELINHKKRFPPKGDIAVNMLREIADSKPKFAFVVEWPANGDLPRFHTSTEDAPVLAYRLQNFLNAIYSGKIKLEIEE